MIFRYRVSLLNGLQVHIHGTILEEAAFLR